MEVILSRCLARDFSESPSVAELARVQTFELFPEFPDEASGSKATCEFGYKSGEAMIWQAAESSDFGLS